MNEKREWYLQYAHPFTTWKPMYAISHAMDDPQYVKVGAYWLNKIYLRTLTELVRDYAESNAIVNFYQDGRTYQLVNINTGEVIPGELFGDQE